MKLRYTELAAEAEQRRLESDSEDRSCGFVATSTTGLMRKMCDYYNRPQGRLLRKRATSESGQRTPTSFQNMKTYPMTG